MRAQHDMFDPQPDRGSVALAENKPDDVPEPPRQEPLAAPCGFRDRSNQPCARLATKPLSIDEIQLVCRGIPMLLCDPACFRGSSPSDDQPNSGHGGPASPDDDPNMGLDPDDPGYDDTWGDGAWERDDGQDAQ
jgi:hypothetical protein